MERVEFIEELQNWMLRQYAGKGERRGRERAPRPQMRQSAPCFAPL